MPYDIPVSSCPYCHCRIDSATDGNNARRTPMKDDLLVCLNCAAFLKLDERLEAMALPASEFTILSPANQAQLLQARENVRTLKPLVKQRLSEN